jgi:hypothetical protein
MKRYRTGRVLAVLFLGVLFGVYKHFMQVRWATLGREAFLADQSRQFDKGMMPPHGELVTMVAGVILAAVAVGLYELLAAGITMVLPVSTVEEL